MDMVFQAAERSSSGLPRAALQITSNGTPAKKNYARRRANAKDVAYAAKVVDGVDDFDCNCYLYDLGEEGQLGLPSELIKTDAMLRNTTKFAGTSARPSLI
jgi:hypothetical protein